MHLYSNIGEPEVNGNIYYRRICNCQLFLNTQFFCVCGFFFFATSACAKMLDYTVPLLLTRWSNAGNILCVVTDISRATLPQVEVACAGTDVVAISTLSENINTGILKYKYWYINLGDNLPSSS